MPGPSPTTPRDFFLAIKNMITAGSPGIYAPAAVAIRLDVEPIALAGPPQCIIQVGNFGQLNQDGDGMGRWGTTVVPTFSVHCITRNVQDQAYADDAFLTSNDATAGVLVKVFAILNLFEGRFVRDANGAMIAEEPLRCVEFAKPRRYSKSTDWGGLESVYTTKIQLNLDTP